jgi:hypothetical protein
MTLKKEHMKVKTSLVAVVETEEAIQLIEF